MPIASNMRGLLLVTAAAVLPTSVYAQTPPSQGEIVITAQRKEERIVNVPIAVVARNAEQLADAGVSNIRDLSITTPGLRVQGNGPNVSPAIRGVNSDQTDPGNDPNVSIYIDGIYQAHGIANNLDLADVSTVEVLKGPQGTLFGRNATGGAIRIFTRDPSLESVEGDIDVSYGAPYDELIGKGYVSVPIIEGKLGASLSYYREESDGWNKSVLTGQDSSGVTSEVVRGKLLFKPAEGVQLKLFGSYSDRNDGQLTAYSVIDGNTEVAGTPGAIFSTKPYEFASATPPQLWARVMTLGFQAVFDIPGGTLTSTTGYNKLKIHYETDGDGSNLYSTDYPITVHQEDYSQEFIFTSEKFGMFQVTGGLFYYHNEGAYDPLILSFTSNPDYGGTGFTGFSVYGYMNQNTEALSAFSEVTMTPTDKLTLIAGARYSYEKRDAQGGYFFVPGRPANVPDLQGTKADSFTLRASARYTFDSGDNVYFTYSRGFKSGGIVLSNPGSPNFRPEKLDAFEIGLKTNPSRMLSGNFSVFFYDYKDKQVQANVNGTNITTNAGAEEIMGFDADVTARLTDSLTLTATAAYLDAEWSEYKGAAVNKRYPAGSGCFGNYTTGTVNPCFPVLIPGVDPNPPLDLTGGRPPFTPEFSGSVMAKYVANVFGGELDLSGTVYYTGEFSFDNNDRVKQDAYTTVAARAGFTPGGTNLQVYIWGKNITDETYLQSVFIGNSGDMGSYARPATYGVGARYTF